MRRAPLAAVALAVLSAAVIDAGEPAAPVTLGPEETVVFYGDSITQQNLYSAYLETFLLSRFPDKRLAVFNCGWGGDTASGGVRRFARDVAPVAPTLVFVNFGMNDGGYKAYDESIYTWYMESQQELADSIAGLGARQVLFTTSPVDADIREDDGVYNETLARLADGVSALGAERRVPVIDLFHPMLAVQARAKQNQPGFTMIPDSVHPDPVGHLVMAYIAMKSIDAPRGIGEIVIDGEDVAGREGASVSNVRAASDGIAFDLDLGSIPFYVPHDARPALDLVPLQTELNRFVLRREPLQDGPTASWALSADGATLGFFSPEQLEAGIDLALLDAAPWAVAGRQLWEAAQYRWEKHRESWRGMGLEPSTTMLPDLPSFAPFAAAQRAHADAMGQALQSLARPARYAMRLSPLGDVVPIGSVALSPTYPFDGAFDRAHAPETAPDSVEWTPAPLENGQIDLSAQFEQSSNVVTYARVVVEADDDCTLHLSMGSDDGLAVFLDGERVFAHDVMRGLRPGDDEVEVGLSKGQRDLLFKVTQGGGGFGLAVAARVYGTATVRQVIPIS